MDYYMIKSELRVVVNQYITQVSKGERELIAAFIVSAVAPAVRVDLDRSYQKNQ